MSLGFVEALEKSDILRGNVFSLKQTRLYVIGPPSIIFDCTAEVSLAISMSPLTLQQAHKDSEGNITSYKCRIYAPDVLLTGSPTATITDVTVISYNSDEASD